VPSFTDSIDRQGTDSIKWGKYAGRDILPLWVADMDFAAPPAVLAALQQRVAHGVFGYGQSSPGANAAVCDHLQRHYDWTIEPDWIVWLPGLVTGFNLACRLGQGEVLTAGPVYPPFFSAPRHAGRTLRRVDLLCDADSRWHWDFSALSQALTVGKSASSAAPGERLFMLCHPHNPVGRCWSRPELERLAELAEAHDLLVCSDEIHCGLVLEEGLRHIPFASLSPAMARRTITLMAPSKTFNIPGLGCAFAVIPDPTLRRRFLRVMDGIIPHVNVLGMVACEAAYRDSDDWHRELIATLRHHRDRIRATVDRLSGIKMSPLEATYLAWLDVRALNLPHPHAHFEAHGLGLSDGADFGAPGWLRLNFGCTEATLDLALQRLEAAWRAATA
jgi:cystathionine beta-lyase